MKKKINDKEAFNVERFCRNKTKGQKKQRGQRVLSEHVQTKFPWYDQIKIKRNPPIQ